MGCAAQNQQVSPDQIQVEAWLRNELSLPQYTDSFISNGYDRFDAVYEMNESDLRAMGVKRGHIKIILKAVRDRQVISNGDETQTVYATPGSNGINQMNHPPAYQEGLPSYGVVAPVDNAEGMASAIVQDQHYLSWHGSSAPSKKNRIGTVTVDHNFAVHITFTVHGNIEDNYGDILHIGPTDTKGHRTPQLFFDHRVGPLSLALRINHSGDTVWGNNVGGYRNYTCQIGQTYKVVIICKDGKGSMSINGQSVWNNTNFHPIIQRNVGVWLCVGGSPANVTVRDLLVYRP